MCGRLKGQPGAQPLRVALCGRLLQLDNLGEGLRLVACGGNELGLKGCSLSRNVEGSLGFSRLIQPLLNGGLLLLENINVLETRVEGRQLLMALLLLSSGLQSMFVMAIEALEYRVPVPREARGGVEEASSDKATSHKVTCEASIGRSDAAKKLQNTQEPCERLLSLPCLSSVQATPV